MLLTEQEAKQERCIGSMNCGERRGIGEPYTIVDNPTYPEDPAADVEIAAYREYGRFCIGSACKMGWRWAKGSEVEVIRAWLPPGHEDADDAETVLGEWTRTKAHTRDTLPEWTRTVERKGYCGIAGKPEA